MKTIRELLDSGEITLDTKVLGELPTNADGDIWGCNATAWAYDIHEGKVLAMTWDLVPDWHSVQFCDSYSSKEAAERAPREED